MFDFKVISGTVVKAVIENNRPSVVDAVRQAYLDHHDGRSINPNSYFLRFPDKPSARIIALPAYLGGDCDVAGVKWIGSFPENIERNVPRASAVLLLNDYETGYPFACIEASQISAARTAASAVAGAEQLHGGKRAKRIAVVGAGVIARNIVEFFVSDDWAVDTFVFHDKVPAYAEALRSHTESMGPGAIVADTFEDAVAGADIVVLATVAGEPYITDPAAFAAGQVVLNISLRDISPEIIANSYNVLDDVGHCMTANTSPHLAEQKYGHRDFVTGTLAELLRGEVAVAGDKPKIFSPFGLGVLDLAVGMLVYRAARAQDTAVDIPGFFVETERWR